MWLAPIDHAAEVFGYLQGPERNWTSGRVDATVGKSGVDVHGRVTDRRSIGEENRWQGGIAAAHPGHAAKADTRHQVMAAISPSGNRCPWTARAGLEEVSAGADY